MSHATIGKWGKSLGVRLPAEAARALGLGVGSEVEIFAREQEIVLRAKDRKRTLEEWFEGKTDEEWRELYRDAYDWGPDVGREIVDE